MKPPPPRHRRVAPAGRRTGAGRLVLLGLGGLLDIVSTLALPVALGRTVDAMVGGGPYGNRIALIIGLILIGLSGDLVGAYASTMYVAGATARLRSRLVRHVLGVGPSGLRTFDTGDLVTRVSGNAVDAVQSGPAIVSVVTATALPVGSLVLLTTIDPWLAAALLAGTALVALVLRAFTRRTAEAAALYQAVQARLAARFAESLTGSRTVAAAGTVDQEERRVLEPLVELRRHGDQMWRVVSRSTAQAAVAGPLILVAVLAVGGFALAAGRISAGDLVAASRYATLGVGLGGLTGALGRVARSRAGRRRIDEVLTLPEIRYGRRDLPDPAGPGSPIGKVELRGVAVSDAGTTLLDGIDLTLPEGAAVAVVGRSGAGKSVLAAVVARLRDPSAGCVLLDGVPLKALSHHALRHAVGAAFERPVLFGHTVGQAIGPGLGAEPVRAAARAAEAHDFIAKLPHGYDTALAETPMSGGEAQRLALARAWPATRVLVLDDATSSLDMITEMRIARALETGRDCRTRLIVTHRAATAARADVVVWLDGGRVRALGPHHLLWTDADYRAAFG
jgi:ATP-binding cassette subfamily B protein